MSRLLSPFVTVIRSAALSIFSGLTGSGGHSLPCHLASEQAVEPGGRPAPNALNCRIRLTKQQKDNSVLNVFEMQICGLIHAPGNLHYTTAQISIVDVTDGLPKAVHSKARQQQTKDSGVFCYNAELGRLPSADTLLSDWTGIAQIQADWLILPRKGERNLQFAVSILSQQTGQELAYAECTFTYENPTVGYIDLQENRRRTKTLAVALAFAVSAADKKMFACEVELIKNWARANFDSPNSTKKDKRKLEKVLNRTVSFFRDGHQLDNFKICKEIVEISPLAERYDILELCLQVVRAKGVATMEELTVLKNLATWLEVDPDRFHSMLGKNLPVSMHETKNTELVLGLAPEMGQEKTRRHLNREYSRWNSRVTNTDPKIRSQADQMLKLITEARNRCIKS